MPTHFKQTTRVWALATLSIIAVSCQAVPVLADELVNTGYFGGVAIMGYDPVAYFTDNKAVKGSEKYSYDWLGTPWHFASSEHKEMFAADPIKIRAAIRRLLRRRSCGRFGHRRH